MKVASSPTTDKQPARTTEKPKAQERPSLKEQAHEVGERIGESLGEMMRNGGERENGEMLQDFFSGLADSFADLFGSDGGGHCCCPGRGPRRGQGEDDGDSGGGRMNGPGRSGGSRRGGRTEPGGGTQAPGKVGQSGGISSASGSDDPAKQAAWINDYLSQQGSPAAGQNAGEYFVKYGQENNVDPMVLLSIAGQETQFGKLGVGVNGMLGVGAFDDDPDNSTRNSKYSGVENQIRLGAETFADLREKGGASADDPIEVQTAAVNKAGWATDPNWHTGVDRWYGQISQAAGAQEPAPSAPNSDDPAASQLGLAARNYGVDSPKINPGRGNTDWYYYCLGWTNQAFKDQGKTIPELQTENAHDAYQAAKANGKVQTGNPPPGAIVFFPDAAGGEGHIGIMNEDGTYRGTVPSTENPRTIGDRQLQNPDQVYWMYP